MTHYFVAYICAAVTFISLDFLWLRFLAMDFYEKHLGALLLDEINTPVAVGFYLIYLIGVLIFAIVPVLKNGQPKHALMYGALFGFFAYATYDMTNMATLKNWPVFLSVVDIGWGVTVTGLSALAGCWGAQKIYTQA